MIEVKIPQFGESVTYAELTNWLVEDGSYIDKDQEIVELDSDKASFTIPAEESGKINILVQPGKVGVGDVIAKIDTAVSKPMKTANTEGIQPQTVGKAEQKPSTEVKENAKISSGVAIESKSNLQQLPIDNHSADFKLHISPVAAKMIEENKLDIDQITADKILRITKNDVQQYLQRKDSKPEIKLSRETSMKELSPLRKKLAERLVNYKNETAMLTTYNEADMSHIMKIRKQYGDTFQQKYGIKLGFMSFFAKASAIALQEFKEVNASINGDHIIYHEYVDLGIAVSTEKGLMVPVIRNTESLSIAEIEKEIHSLAEKARNRKISIDEMTGGTFTITNGGVFGSLFSSPIINPPQVAILGMHKIQERPVGMDGQIVLRPMMYLSLSYDHRIIDGKDSVSFLVRVKELLEEPCKLSMDCAGVAERLLRI